MARLIRDHGVVVDLADDPTNLFSPQRHDLVDHDLRRLLQPIHVRLGRLSADRRIASARVDDSEQYDDDSCLGKKVGLNDHRGPRFADNRR